MDDLISRKRALEEMTFSCGIEQDGVLYVPLRDVNNHLKSLPSVHPKVDEWCTDCPAYDHEKHYCPRFRRVIRRTVQEIEERKKGKWFLTDTMYACNQCNSVFYETSPFCPNCGSDMQGSEQE